MVAVEPVRVRPNHSEAAKRDLSAVEVRGRRGNADVRIGRVAVAGRLLDHCRRRLAARAGSAAPALSSPPAALQGALGMSLGTGIWSSGTFSRTSPAEIQPPARVGVRTCSQSPADVRPKTVSGVSFATFALTRTPCPGPCAPGRPRSSARSSSHRRAAAGWGTRSRGSAWRLGRRAGGKLRELHVGRIFDRRGPAAGDQGLLDERAVGHVDIPQQPLARGLVALALVLDEVERAAASRGRGWPRSRPRSRAGQRSGVSTPM